MNKEEILEYVYKNCEIPQEALKYILLNLQGASDSLFSWNKRDTTK